MRVRLALSLAILLSGCEMLTGYSHAYPIDWPARVALESGCPNLHGVYVDLAIPKYQKSFDVRKYLSYHFFGELQERAIHKERNDVRITLVGEEQLKFELLQSGNPVNEIVLLRNKDEFVCREGILWIDSEKDSQADGLGGYKSWAKLGLQLAEDRSLVGQVHSSSVGLAMWAIPIGGKQVFWYQWPRTLQPTSHSRLTL